MGMVGLNCLKSSKKLLTWRLFLAIEGTENRRKKGFFSLAGRGGLLPIND